MDDVPTKGTHASVQSIAIAWPGEEPHRSRHFARVERMHVCDPFGVLGVPRCMPVEAGYFKGVLKWEGDVAPVALI